MQPGICFALSGTHVDNVFRGQEIESFYPYAEVVFEIKDPSKHYHIPLLLNPFGYSTYRGS